MLGTNSEPGICARALGDLFHAIEECSSDAEHEVSMSYLEVHGKAGMFHLRGRQGAASGTQPGCRCAAGLCPLWVPMPRGMFPAPPSDLQWRSPPRSTMR